MINRRNFLRATAGLAIGALHSGCTSSKTSTLTGAGRNRIDRIGIQLYTVRDQMRQDFEGTLRKVAAVGYKEFEFAGFYEHTPEQVRQLLDELNVTAPSAHIGYEIVRDDLDRAMTEARVIGYKYITVPSLPNEMRSEIDGYKTAAEVFNRAGEQLKGQELRLAYHNHAFEFEERNGQVPYDLLLSETDPALVDMEVDLYWMKKGGRDPIAYFDKYPGRFALAHVKDMGQDGEIATVGEGVTDWTEIFSKAREAGLKHYIVEHDNAKDPMQSIASSFSHLNELMF